MDDVCLCTDCKFWLINELVQEHEDIEFNDRGPHVSGNTPCIDLCYNHENGHEYNRSIYADANYCCQCGKKL